MSLSALKKKVDCIASGRGTIFYVGDLEWAQDRLNKGLHSYNPSNTCCIHFCGNLCGLCIEQKRLVWRNGLSHGGHLFSSSFFPNSNC
uniref:SMAX1-like nucleotide binding domain-containing protein n=1 Tax=Glycine max TaxID=3847 RepID=A0A0R0GDZ7_SOYBN